MAIHPNLPGVVVGLFLNGQRIQEHADTEQREEDAKTVTRYVKATSNAAFAIGVALLPAALHAFAFDSLIFYTAVEGQQVDHFVVFKEELQLVGIQKFRPGRMSATGILEPFKFAPIKIDEDDDDGPDLDARRIKDLGTITVTVRQGFRTGLVPPDVAANALPEAADIQRIETLPEKALKGSAVSHSVQLGEPVQTDSAARLWSVHTDMRPEAYAAKFVFHYRSKNGLRDLQIVECTPSPSELTRLDVADLSGDQAKSMLETIKQRSIEEAQGKGKGPRVGSR